MVSIFAGLIVLQTKEKTNLLSPWFLSIHSYEPIILCTYEVTSACAFTFERVIYAAQKSISLAARARARHSVLIISISNDIRQTAMIFSFEIFQ